MDRLAVELLQHIFLLACTDGGLTGAALARVSKHIRAVSRAARFHSIVLLDPSPRQVPAFYAAFTKERDEPDGTVPRVRNLLLASAVREIDPRSLGRYEPKGSTAAANAEDPKQQLRRAYEQERCQYHHDITALIQVLAPDLRSLSILHCHRYGKLELRFPDMIEVPGGFPMLDELTIAGLQTKFVSPPDAPCDPPYPSLTKLHINLVALSGCPDLDLVSWGDCAPNLTHLRLTNINYWPRNMLEALTKVFDSPHLTSTLRQIIVQPAAPPPMGGPCGTSPFVFTSFIQRLEDICRPASVPTTLLPTGRQMKERDWEALARAHWLSRVCDGGGCWDTRECQPPKTSLVVEIGEKNREGGVGAEGSGQAGGDQAHWGPLRMEFGHGMLSACLGC